MNRVLGILLLLSWCVALLFVRVMKSGTVTYAFLLWNLILAIVPAVAASAFSRACRRDGAVALPLVCGLAWLAFLPNAPYIATDFLHLRPRPPVPLWFDVALLLSCTVAGLLLCYVSVAEVQSALRRRLGVVQSWLCAIAALFLCGFGIYLGRFLRWNSWHVLTDPFGLLADVVARVTNPLAHPRTVAITVLYGVGLVVGYGVFCGMGGGEREVSGSR